MLWPCERAQANRDSVSSVLPLPLAGAAMTTAMADGAASVQQPGSQRSCSGQQGVGGVVSAAQQPRHIHFR